VIAAAGAELVADMGRARASALLGRSRATHYRHATVTASRPVHGPRRARPAPANALTPAERNRVLQLLTSGQYRDKSVAQTWATLLDDGTYVASMSTMHRVLREAGLAGERAPRPPTRPGPARSCSPPGLSRSGAGTSPSCAARCAGCTTNSTC